MVRATRYLPIVLLAVSIAGWGLAIGQEPRPTFDRKKRPEAKSSESVPETQPSPAEKRPSAPSPGQKAEATDKPAASKEQIAAWIRELDADEFFTRETATLQLLEAGPTVLTALGPVLNGGTLEATSRALFIVRQLGVAADIDTQDQSGQLLAELASRTEAPALARRAAAALEELAQQRSANALSELEQLGAKIARSQISGGLVLDEPVLSIHIGDAFHGEERDLRRLKWVTEVPVLILQGKRVTDGWIKQAAAMPSMEELHLYQAQISDAALTVLADDGVKDPAAAPAGPKGSKLKQIGIYYTPIGEAALAPLAKLPLLGFVKLYGTRVTKAGVEKFKATSGVAIDYRRGAFLGVGGLDVDGSCRISTIHDGSPAAKAGLMREDVIVRFGTDAVGNFSSLTELISQCDVGDEVEIEVARPAIDDQGIPALRTIATKVKLAPWEVEPAVRNSRR